MSAMNRVLPVLTLCRMWCRKFAPTLAECYSGLSARLQGSDVQSGSTGRTKVGRKEFGANASLEGTECTLVGAKSWKLTQQRWPKLHAGFSSGKTFEKEEEKKSFRHCPDHFYPPPPFSTFSNLFYSNVQNLVQMIWNLGRYHNCICVCCVSCIGGRVMVCDTVVLGWVKIRTWLSDKANKSTRA